MAVKVKIRNFQLRFLILQKYGTQVDFAADLGVDASKVANVLNERRKLCRDEAAIWARKIGCDPELLEQVTKGETQKCRAC